ncbi:MAG: AAA family ATPase [Bacillota bacterium]
MIGRSVTFTKVALEGVGPYRDRVEFQFTPGMNNVVAANESGKSSLVRGLMAVIFGLSAKMNTLKNWDDPRKFEGEVEFWAGEEQYRIERKLNTGHVTVSRLARGKWQSVISGTHKPSGKRNETYEEFLAQHFGLSAQDLYAATFCVTQPMPDQDTLGANVQELLSGGGVDFKRVLSSLSEELKSITKYTRDRGVTDSNMLKNRALEELREKIKELEDRIDQGRNTVNSLHEVRAQLKQLDAEIGKTQEELGRKKKTLDALSDWRRLRQESIRANQDLEKLDGAVKEAEELKKHIDASLEELKRVYPEFLDAPEDVDEQLHALIAIRAKRDEAEKYLAELKDAIEKARIEEEALKEELAAYPRWEELGGDPVGRVRVLRRDADALTREWESLQNTIERIRECESCLQGKYAMFQQAGKEELEDLRVYSRRLHALSAGVEETVRERKRAEEKVQSYRKALDEICDRYKDLESTGPGAREAAEQKLALLERVQVLEKDAGSLRKEIAPRRGLQLAAAALLAMGAGALAWMLAGPQRLFVLSACALIGALAGYVVAGRVKSRLDSAKRQQLLGLEQDLAACLAQMSALDRELGCYAKAGAAALGALIERLRQRGEDLAKAEDLKKDLPSDEELKSLLERERDAREAYDAFDSRVRKFKDAYGDVESALMTWQGLVSRKEELSNAALRMSRASFGCEPHLAASVGTSDSGLSDTWREMFRCLNIIAPDDALCRMGPAVDFLRGRTPGWWEALERRAAAYAGITERLRELKAAAAANVRLETEYAGRIKRLKDDDARAAAGLEQILKAADGDAGKARMRWESYRALLLEIQRKQERLGGVFEQNSAISMEDLKQRRKHAEVLAGICMKEWRDHIQNHPGLPEISEAGDIEKVSSRVSALQDDVERLQVRLNGLKEKESQLLKDESRLQGLDPINIAQAEGELHELREREQELELLADALTEAYKELDGAVADYQHSYRQHLQDLATQYYRQITGVDDRIVLITKDFEVKVEEAGQPCEISQLSKGAEDQLYIALRFAVADLLVDNVRLPFIFDDSFASTDKGRLDNIRAILEQESKRRQFIILSHNEMFLNWGNPVSIPR